MPRAKVSINHETCIACAACYNICPDVYAANDEGKSILVEEFRTEAENVGEIPEDLYDCAIEGRDSCPTDSITVEEL